ncbi:MAG: ornithine cyclodeaminase [Roseovarius sp.]
MIRASSHSDRLSTIRLEDLAGHVTWRGVADAIAEGHRRDQPELGDVLLEQDGCAWLTRAARIRGLGSLTKVASVYPDNPAKGLAAIHGAAILMDDETGKVCAIIDNDALTRVKTAADSLLGARLLARPEASRYLVVGAGTVAGDLVRAMGSEFDFESISIWNRTSERAERLCAELAGEGIEAAAVTDLEAAVRAADIVSAATMSRAPLVLGAWVRPGTHVDLVGAFTPEMRESDDALIACAQIFVDCRLTTETRTGDLAGPLARGVIGPQDIRGSLYPLCNGKAGREGADAITLFKNGGGGHIDLMVAQHLFSCLSSAGRA